jgi:hypothetical protein
MLKVNKLRASPLLTSFCELESAAPSAQEDFFQGCVFLFFKEGIFFNERKGIGLCFTQDMHIPQDMGDPEIWNA